MERRSFVMLGAATGLGLVTSCRTQSPRALEGSDDLAPAEDLMREHGVLNRILLVYEEGIRRLEGGGTPASQLLASAAIVRSFVENYHEKLEEEFVFPRFERAEKHVDLVNVLRGQHRAGRRLTDELIGALRGNSTDGSRNIARILRSFIRMYRPHEAREDTVLFPAMRSVMGPKELAELGERFEVKERALFGESGFESIVEEVTTIEQELDIADLSRFTPAS